MTRGALAVSLVLALSVAAQRGPGPAQRQQREQGQRQRQPPPANGCGLAARLVVEVKAMHASASTDHAKVLDHLRTVHDSCPGVDHGISRYGYCSALAVGDADKAERFKQGIRGVIPDCTRPVVTTLPVSIRQKFALVIGIGAFRDQTIPPLKFAAKDAADFARALTEHGGFPQQNVTLLTDQKATRAGILGAIQQLILLAREDDLVVLFVSSHGSPRREEQGLGGAGHIVTYDTSSTELWTDAIEYEDFASKTSRIKARRKVAFLDTCYSGQATRPGSRGLTIEHAGVDDKTARLFLSGEGTAVITSSKPTERSWESDALQNGFFTYYVVDAFKRSKELPGVREVFEYISVRVPDAVAREKRESQHPQMHPSNGPGEVRLSVREARREDEIAVAGPVRNLPDVVAAADDAMFVLRSQPYTVRGQLRATQSDPNAALQGVITTDLVLDVRLIEGTTVHDTFTITGRGGGFTSDASALQARERLRDALRRHMQKESS